MEKRARELQLEVNKKLGPDTIILGSQLFNQTLPRIPSASLAVDVALGGGWPVQRWNEIYGDESSGKTMMVLKTIAANQQNDKKFMTWWVAAEDFDPDYAVMCGCDLERIMVLDNNLSESVFEATLKAMSSRAFDCVVIDSLPALVPEIEARKEMGESPMMRQAWLNGQFLRKSKAAMHRSVIESDRYVTGFVINQWREKVVSFGDPRTTPGGRAKNYWYSTRIELKRDEWIETGKYPHAVRVGQVVKVLAFKNKSARPQLVATLDFHFADHGPFTAGQYDELKEVIALGLMKNVIEQRRGGWYYFRDSKWRGHPEMVEELRYDLGMRQAITKEVLHSIDPAIELPPPPKRAQRVIEAKSRPTQVRPRKR